MFSASHLTCHSASPLLACRNAKRSVFTAEKVSFGSSRALGRTRFRRRIPEARFLEVSPFHRVGSAQFRKKPLPHPRIGIGLHDASGADSFAGRGNWRLDGFAEKRRR